MTAVFLVVFSSRHWQLLSVGQLYTMLLFRNFCSYTEYTLMYPNLTFLKWYTRYFEKKKEVITALYYLSYQWVSKLGHFYLFIYFLNWYTIVLGFPGGSVVKNLPAKARCGCNLWVRQISWGRKSHGQRSLAGYRSWDHERVGHNLATK